MATNHDRHHPAFKSNRLSSHANRWGNHAGDCSCDQAVDPVGFAAKVGEADE
jgi:hypothetical protein